MVINDRGERDNGKRQVKENMDLDGMGFGD